MTYTLHLQRNLSDKIDLIVDFIECYEYLKSKSVTDDKSLLMGIIHKGIATQFLSYEFEGYIDINRFHDDFGSYYYSLERVTDSKSFEEVIDELDKKIFVTLSRHFDNRHNAKAFDDIIKRDIINFKCMKNLLYVFTIDSSGVLND